MQDQQVVQAFLPNTPQKAFADGVGAFRMNRRFEDLDGARCRYTSKTRPELALVITDQVLRGLSIRGGFSAAGCERSSWTSEWFAYRCVGPVSTVLHEYAQHPKADCSSPF